MLAAGRSIHFKPMLRQVLCFDSEAVFGLLSILLVLGKKEKKTKKQHVVVCGVPGGIHGKLLSSSNAQEHEWHLSSEITSTN